MSDKKTLTYLPEIIYQSLLQKAHNFPLIIKKKDKNRKKPPTNYSLLPSWFVYFDLLIMLVCLHYAVLLSNQFSLLFLGGFHIEREKEDAGKRGNIFKFKEKRYD